MVSMYKEAASGGGDGEHYSRLIRELCALLVTIISPAAAPAAAAERRQMRSPSTGNTAMSPAAAATMLLGASMALMLCGSVTFAIGFLLMPWVAGVAVLFGLAAAVSALSSGVFGNSAANRASSSPATATASRLAAFDKPIQY
uniref:Uncharacterized protein n=1 Tax=Leersia perrieri TaxID=77586 RepID=A0A0D9V9P0_9ORYZ